MKLIYDDGVNYDNRYLVWKIVTYTSIMPKKKPNRKLCSLPLIYLFINIFCILVVKWYIYHIQK